MSGKAFFDTNILAYVVGQKDKRTDTVEALLAAGGTISVQVLNELANVSRTMLRMSWEVDGALAAVRVLCPSPLPLTIDTHDASRRIAAKYGYSIFDGLIAASALEAECDTLYSEGLILTRQGIVASPEGNVPISDNQSSEGSPRAQLSLLVPSPTASPGSHRFGLSDLVVQPELRS